MTTKLTRAELAALFPGRQRAVLAFEQALQQVGDTADAVTANVEATQAIQDATVLLLSLNGTFNNERVLALQSPLGFTDRGAGDEFIIGFDFPFSVTDNGYALVITLAATTNITFARSGTVSTTIPPGPYANDAAAAAGGVALNEIYRVTGGSVAWRQV